MNKSILILGAGSDIAIAVAEKYAQNQYDIILAGRNEGELKTLASHLEIKHKISAKPCKFDALNYESHKGFVASLDPTPEITVSAFGYLGDQTIGQQSWEDAKQIIDVNFSGNVSILNEIANIYEKTGKGTIVGISSVAGDRGRQSNYLYGSAKAAFSVYLAGMRNRLFPAGVSVITVKPGFVDTKMTEGLDLPKPLTAKPEQVANDIFKAVKRKSNTIYSLKIWRLIMLIIKLIPEIIFKRLKL